MLYLHRAERADALVEALAAVVATPLPDPFAPELISVPTRGIERWVAQQLSATLGARTGRRDGICANVDFPTPRRLVTGAVAAASGVDPATDPWLPERCVWPLLELATGDLRRFGAARHLADLFDRYALHRPELVLAWAAGEDGDVAPDLAWQAELWRALRERIGTPSPAERFAQACANLEAEPGLVDLPPRLAVLPLTRLAAGRLAVLRALAARRDVHLFLLHPSPALWDAIAAHGGAVTRRAEDPTLALAHHPLLASWGRDIRELQLVLTRAGEHQDHHHGNEGAHGGDSLLARLQHGIRGDRAPDATQLAMPDRSVQVHSCHGRARQVEVLRDAILHELARDPALEPRDVIVMCPDIEAFAPLIQATFGTVHEGAPYLPVRLADRSLRQTNPVLGVVARVIELAGERLTASQVLDLADREPVRRRFGLDDDALARLERWIRASGIRWGLDAGHRTPFKLGALPAGTWRTGLDRLLLGVTMTEEEQRLFGGTLPVDDVESGAIELAGKLAELVDRLGAAIDALRGPQPVAAWLAAVAAAADALTAPAPLDAWQRTELHRILDDVADEAGGSEVPLSLEEVRELLAERLRGRPTRANFRTGALTVCTLVPMRSVPHRVVCLLGLDDGVFPRKAPRDGDDLTLADPHVGERDGRTEDRQLLLDALMSATDTLLITYTGNDERTNLPRPPAVPVGELLDAIEASGTPREQVVTRHPLQPFDERNYRPGELVPGGPWSFDPVTLRGARALSAERRPRAPFLGAPLPPLEAELIELDDLVRFAERPVRTFLRRRLELYVRELDADVDDRLPVTLDGLDKYKVGEQLVQGLLAGTDERTVALAEIARGSLPPALLGRPVIEEVMPLAREIVAAVPPDASTALDVRVALPDGRTLRGTVAGLAGDTLVRVGFARVRARQRIGTWVRLLALAAAHPEREFDALIAGRAEGSGFVTPRIPPVDAATALDHLEVLLDLYDRGMREPPPLYPETSLAYARAKLAGADALAAARAAWETTFAFPNEDLDEAHLLVLGRRLSFDELFAEPARPDEPWERDEPRRVGRWALRLWAPLLGQMA